MWAGCFVVWKKKKSDWDRFWLTSASLTPSYSLSVSQFSSSPGACLPVLLTTLIMPTTFALDGLEVCSIGHLRQEVVVVVEESLSKDSVLVCDTTPPWNRSGSRPMKTLLTLYSS